MWESHRKAETEDDDSGKWKENYEESDRERETERQKEFERHMKRAVEV